jgi:hypothetical protein
MFITKGFMSTIINLFWNQHESRLRAFWRLLAFIITVFIIALAFAIMIGGLFGSMFAGTATAIPDSTQLLVGSIIQLVATLLALWLAGRFIDRRPFADFGLHIDASWWLDFGFGLALGALLMAGVFLLELAAGWISITGTLQTAAPGQSFLLAILIPLIAFLGVGIYEELLTRGYLLQNLAEGLNIGSIGPRGAIIIAWVISSAIFGLLHLGNPNATAISTFNIALAGIFLGLGYVLTGKLAIPIGLHITWNFFQGNVFGFPVSGGTFSSTTFIAIEQGGPALWTGGAFGPESGLLGVLAMLIGSALTVLWVRWRYQRISLHLPLAQPPVLPHDDTHQPQQEAITEQQPSSPAREQS